MLAQHIQGGITLREFYILLLSALTLFPFQTWAKEYTIYIVTDYERSRMAFEPNYIVIKPGDKVTWVNKLAETHNVMTYPDGFPEGAAGFASPFLEQAGQRWSHSFTKVGTYEYHCVPHMFMGMRGKVIVGSPSKPAAMHKPKPEEVVAYRNILLEYFDADQIDAAGTQVQGEK